jgi:chromosomal replication initiator protein
MYLCRELTPRSTLDIGYYFGGRDHSTVFHAWKKYTNLIKADPAIAADIDMIRARLAWIR